MEVEGGNERKIHVLIYELVGTIFFTYAIFVSGGGYMASTLEEN